MITRRISFKTAFVSLLALIIPKFVSNASTEETLYLVNGKYITFKEFKQQYARSQDKERDYVHLQFTDEQHRIKVQGTTTLIFPKDQPPVKLFEILKSDSKIKVVQRSAPSKPSTPKVK